MSNLSRLEMHNWRRGLKAGDEVVTIVPGNLTDEYVCYIVNGEETEEHEHAFFSRAPGKLLKRKVVEVVRADKGYDIHLDDGTVWNSLTGIPLVKQPDHATRGEALAGELLPEVPELWWS